MKTLVSWIMVFVLGLIVFACRKSSDKNPPNLLGYWNVTGREFLGYFNNIKVYDSTSAAQSGDYANFTSAGKVYFQFNGVKDTSSFNIINSNKVAFTYQSTLDTFAISYPSSTTCTLGYTTPTFDTSFGGISGKAYAVLNIKLSK